MSEKSAYIWSAPRDCATLAAQLRGIGCARVWVKGGVDNPGIATVWPQWTDGRLAAFEAAGIEVCYWAYVYPESPAVQHDAIARALLARPSRDICLNVEVEWDDYDDAYVSSWVRTLRAYLAVRGVSVERIGFSSVPSWDKGHGGTGSPYHAFPYEAFCDACDFSMPQCYWLTPNQALWENRRNTTGKPVIPILTACGEYDDDGMVAIAQLTRDTCRNLAGFSVWEAANASFQADAVRRAYALLPEDAPAQPSRVLGALSYLLTGKMPA